MWIGTEAEGPSKSSSRRDDARSSANGIPLWMWPWITSVGRRRRTTGSSALHPSSGRHSSFSPPIVTYVARFADAYGVRFLQDEDAVFGSDGGRVRLVGSTGSLDRPTWWQRRNLPHLADVYRRRIELLDGLLAGDDVRVLLTHYPPTYVTMGGEKEEWRPELGCKALEPVLLRRRPTLVIHGHVHKGIPAAELRASSVRLEDFEGPSASVPIHNVAYPVRRAVSTFDV